MSHTTTLRNVQIRDVAAIRAAAAELNAAGIKCSIVENVKPRMYYPDQHAECALVLKLDSCKYDVGFDKQEDGTYAPVFDLWDNIVSKKLGATCPMPGTPGAKEQHAIGKFLQGYAKHAAQNAAIMAGYSVESCYTDQSGNVQMVLQEASY